MLRGPLVLITLLALGCATPAVAQAPKKKATPPKAPTPCVDSPAHQAFDFWVGEWEVTNPKGAVVGHNTIRKEEKGCLLTEHWRSARGGSGRSINYLDITKKEWVQVWVDRHGGVIRLRGGLDGAAMKLSGSYVTGKGEVSRLRGTWTPQPDGRVRQFFEESKDDGKTWAPWFDGMYRRVKSG